MKTKWSLMKRLMVSINLTVAILIIAVTYSLTSDAIKEARAQAVEEIESLAKTLSISVVDDVLENKIEDLNFVTAQLLEDEAIEAVYFYNLENKLLAKAEEKDIGNPEHTKIYDLKTPIVNPVDKKNIGILEIKYNQDKATTLQNNLVLRSTISFIIAQFLVFIIAWLILRNTTKNLGEIASTIKNVSDQTKLSSESVKAISEEVSSSTTEQAASIQETVSTLDEITSMVNTSVDGAQNSAKKAEESHTIANDGKEVVKEMMTSMEEIDRSNRNIMEEISKSNERISSITKVIDEISQKTTVINDIVFQTKLLSFNASVEAARAGEHGKGFAVVAEEVGNLAQMSGKASNEISDMLQESINRVNEIINETNRNVQKLINEGNEKVKRGVTIADRCGKVLDDVVDNAAIVKNMMNEVLVASKEQADGVRNITQAMNQLDQTTHANANAANRSFENSKELSMQAENLKKNVEILEVEIFGGNNVYSLQKAKNEKTKNFDNVLPLKKEGANSAVNITSTPPKTELAKASTSFMDKKVETKPHHPTSTTPVQTQATVEIPKKAEVIDIKHATKKQSEVVSKPHPVETKKPVAAKPPETKTETKKPSALSSLFGKKKTEEKVIEKVNTVKNDKSPVKVEAVKPVEVKKASSDSAEKSAQKASNLQVPSHNDPRFEDV